MMGSARPGWGAAGGVVVLAVALTAAAPAAGVQLSSTRSDGLTPALVGLFPDDWTDAVLNPAALPAGSLAFGRVDWSVRAKAQRRLVAGGRGAAGSLGVLGAGGVDLDRRGASPGDHAVVAMRYGREQAIGLRLGTFRPAGVEGRGHTLLAAYRAPAGDGWSVDVLAEAAAVPGVDAASRYGAGELLLRQPGPERAPGDPGWRYRVLRLRGGSGRGAVDPDYPRHDAILWVEASVVHLHGGAAARLPLAVAWAVRYSGHHLDAAPCPPGQCPSPRHPGRHAIAVDGAVEAMPADRVALRAGTTRVVLARGDQLYLARRWTEHATLVPAGLAFGIWAGFGWHIHRGLSLDAAIDAASEGFESAPVTVQATYRFR